MAIATAIANFDLRALDRLDVDALVLPLYSVVEQPQGAAAYLDWRLAGALGRLVKSGKFTGAPGEAMLMSYASRIRPGRVFLIGLGPRKKPDRARSAKHVADVLKVLAGAQARTVALGLPAPLSEDLVAGWVAAEGWDNAKLDRLWLLDPDGELIRHRSALEEAAHALRWEDDRGGKTKGRKGS